MAEYYLNVLNLVWEGDSPEGAVKDYLSQPGAASQLVWTVTDSEVTILPAEYAFTKAFAVADNFKVRLEVETEDWDG